VLRRVGNDVALAVDWIMENGDELATWMSELEPGASEAGEGEQSVEIRAGSRIVTSDGKQGSVARVHEDGTYDLHLDEPASPRLRVWRSDFELSSEDEALLPRPILSSPNDMQAPSLAADGLDRSELTPSISAAGQAALDPPLLPPIEMNYEDNLEDDDMDEDDHGEPEVDLARLLSHLREFSELASMVSIQATAAQQGQSGANEGRNSSAVRSGPVLAVGDHVVLAPGAVRSSDGSRGPMRRSDVGEVLEVGESHVCVRVISANPAPLAPGGSVLGGGTILPGAAGLAGVLGLAPLGSVLVGSLPPGAGLGSTPGRWWYANSSLAIAPAQDAATAAGGAGGAAVSTPTRDSSWIRSPLKDPVSTEAAARRILSRFAGERGDKRGNYEELITMCNGEEQLLDALAVGLSMCTNPSAHGQLSKASMAALDSLLLVADAVAKALFLDREKHQDGKGVLAVGDVVKFKPEAASDESYEGVITDDLGFGRLCVYSTVSRKSHDIERSTTRLSKRQQVAPGAESRMATGVLSYLNELLISRAVPLGDLSIVQRVLADGAHIEHRDAEGNTPLLLSVEKNGSLDLVTVLLQHGASVNAENFAGRSPLAAAVEKDALALVKRLLESGANPEKVGDEALLKCSEEIRVLVEEKRALIAMPKVTVGLNMDADMTAVDDAKQKYLKMNLPALLRVYSAAPAGLAPQAERALALTVLIVLENLPEWMQQYIDSAIAGLVYTLAEDFLISQTSYDVLIALRLMQALLRADATHAARVYRYYLLPIFQELAQERGAVFEQLSSQPTSAIALAHQPAAALLSKVLPSTEATAQGVSLLARRVLKLMDSELDAPSPAAANSSIKCGKDSLSSDLLQRLAGGDERAVQEFRDAVLQVESFTSKELQESGLLDALLSFLQPEDSALHPQRIAYFWKTMVEKPTCSGGDVLAICSLLRRLQKVVSVQETLDAPFQLSGFSALALGMDRGMRLLLEPHRVEIVPMNNLVKSSIAAAKTAADAEAEESASVLKSASFEASVESGGNSQVTSDGDRKPGGVATVAGKGSTGRQVGSPNNTAVDFSNIDSEPGISQTSAQKDGASDMKSPPSNAATFEGEQAQVDDNIEARNIVSVLVEPLVPVTQLSSHILRLSKIEDPLYEEYCRGLVGTIIFDRPRMLLTELAVPYRRALVEGYRHLAVSGVAVHQLRYFDSDTCADPAVQSSNTLDDRVEVVLAVRDYRLTRDRVPHSTFSEHATLLFESSAAAWAEAAGEEERCYMVMITYPHEAVPMDIFVDSVMGSVLQALRQADPGQIPYGKQYGDEYDFPARGFADGQPEFQECLTRGLSEPPYEAAVARAQTRREAQVLLSRLNGICEASLKVDRSKNFMPALQQTSELLAGSRILSKYGRDGVGAENALATVITPGKGRRASTTASAADRYTIVYDDGVIAEAVPYNSMRPLVKRQAPAPPVPGRQLVYALGRAAPLSAEEWSTNPAALSRAFKSFLRKGEDAVPIRYEMTEDAANIVRFA
jgi:hypothetical protein